MAKTVREVMTSNPRTVEANQPVVEAARIMKNEDVGIVPVVEGTQLTGTVTDRDIALRVIADGRDPQSTTVRDIASTKLITIDPDQELDEALRLMGQHQVRRLPVVQEDGRLVGMLAQADVAMEVEPARTGQMVEDISR